MHNYVLQSTAFQFQSEFYVVFYGPIFYLQGSRKSENQYLAVNGALEYLHPKTVNYSFILG
jgi:hypothetical protein